MDKRDARKITVRKQTPGDILRRDDKAVRSLALKELEALNAEVGRIKTRIATLTELLKAA